MSTKYVLFEDASKKLVGVFLVGCYKDGRWQLHHGDTVLLNLCKAWDSKNWPLMRASRNIPRRAQAVNFFPNHHASILLKYGRETWEIANFQRVVS